MAVERRPRQRITLVHLVLHPFLVELLQRQLPESPERVDDPDVLVKI